MFKNILPDASQSSSVVFKASPTSARPVDLPLNLEISSLEDAYDFNCSNKRKPELLRAPSTSPWFFQEPDSLAILPRRPSFIPADLRAIPAFESQNRLTEAFMTRLAKSLIRPTKSIQLLSLGGESGSGKSTLAAHINAEFNRTGLRTLVLGTDGYMCTMGQIIDGCRKEDIFDDDSLLKHLKGLLLTPEIEQTIPCFDYAVAGHSKIMRQHKGKDYDLIVLEGLFAHSNQALVDLASLKVSITAAADIRLQRCILRCPEDAGMWTGLHSWLFSNVSDRVAFAESSADWILDAEFGHFLSKVN